MKVVYSIRNPGIVSRTPAGWDADVISAGGDGLYAEEELARVGDADALVVGLEPVGEQLLARAPRLRLIQRLGRGFCTVDLDAAARRRIPVAGMPDFNAATVAEHALMLALGLLRGVFESTLLMKAGRWPVADVVSRGVFDLAGKTVGVVGLGAIGQAVARRALAFDAHVVYHDPERAAPPELARAGVEPTTLGRLLGEADVVTLHVPLTAQTRGLIGRAELALMKRTAILVNTARGAVVDEVALSEALQRAAIAGAGIDVFAEEPLPPSHPLRRCPNVLLTPHTGGQTREAMERMVTVMVENLERVGRGEPPRYVISPPAAS